MSREGLIEAARFSWNCCSNDRAFCDGLYSFVGGNGGKSDEWIENCLKQLYSYFYYLLIAQQNRIDDPFELQVVQAHWIGNDLLQLPTASDIQKIITSIEFSILPEEKRRMIRMLLSSLVRSESLPHHSFHASIYERLTPKLVRYGKRCFVECGDVLGLKNDSLILKIDDKERECGYGFLRGKVHIGDLVLVHLNDVRRMATEIERIRLTDYSFAIECTLKLI